MLPGVVDEQPMPADTGHAARPESFSELFGQVTAGFGRPRRIENGRAFVLGLPSHAGRKNGWALAEFRRSLTPDGRQPLVTSRRGTPARNPEPVLYFPGNWQHSKPTTRRSRARPRPRMSLSAVSTLTTHPGSSQAPCSQSLSSTAVRHRPARRAGQLRHHH
jgi:hypothetical protein